MPAAKVSICVNSQKTMIPKVTIQKIRSRQAFGRISFDEFLAELLGLASDASSGEPEKIPRHSKTALLESGDGITQVRFQFVPVVGRKEIGLAAASSSPPAFNGGVQIETGFDFP